MLSGQTARVSSSDEKVHRRYFYRRIDHEGGVEYRHLTPSLTKESIGFILKSTMKKFSKELSEIKTRRKIRRHIKWAKKQTHNSAR